MYPIAFAMIAVALGNVLYASFAGGSFTRPADLENLMEARKNAWSLLGASAGLPLIILLDERFIHWDGKGSLPVQIVKIAVGLLLTVCLKEGLKMLLELLPGDLTFRHGIRYFLVVLFAGAAYPAVFEWILRRRRTV